MKTSKKTIYFLIKGMVLTCVCAIIATLCSCSSLFEICNHTYLGEYLTNDYSHTATCDNCRETFESERHNFGDMVTVSEPSDTADGEGYYECYTCGYRSTKVIHNFVKMELVNSTCAKLGTYDHFVCASCGKLFDTHYDEIEQIDINIPKKEHSALNPNPDVIEAPTPSTTGKLKLRCDRFENCGGYVSHNNKTIEIILPKLEKTENYTVISEEGGSAVLQLKELYVKSYLEKTIASDMYRSSIATAVARLEFVYDSCNSLGHQFTENSFVNEDNKLFYICERDPSHKLEISLPIIESGEYTAYRFYATCVRSEGYEYRLGVSSWEAVLSKFESELIAKDSTLRAYAQALTDNFYLFVSDGGEPDPNRHINNDNVTVKKFVAPTYDVLSGGKPTVGYAECYCGDCETKFSVDVDYSSGVWRKAGNILDHKFYRDYSLYGKTFSSAAREGFNYRIDPNGGTVADGVLLTGYTDAGLDEAGSTSPRIVNNDFTREGYVISSITVIVDFYEEGTDRVTKTTGWLPSYGFNCTYWDIDMSTDEYMGDVLIRINWRYA